MISRRVWCVDSLTLPFLLALLFLLPLFASAQVVSPKEINWYCSGGAPLVDGQHYAPVDGFCTYLSPTITGLRYGDLYRGTPGNATIVNGHQLGDSIESTQQGDDISNPQQDEDFFVAIYETRIGPNFIDDLPTFRAYFQQGQFAPPHSNWGIIRFKYGQSQQRIDPVIIIPGILGSAEHNGQWVIDPIRHSYDDLIRTLEANGYSNGLNLFPFPYDWELSNVFTAGLLKLKIQQVKQICDCEKVDIVAHSMGGLIARQYIQSVDYDQDIDQLIFLGTPHLGAPKAYLMSEGAVLDIDFFDQLLVTALSYDALTEGYLTLFDYIHQKPVLSIRELLPTFSYLFDESTLRSYPSNYPSNSFLENLESTKNSLLNSDVSVVNVVGIQEQQNTITALQVASSPETFPLWQHGRPVGLIEGIGNRGLLRGSGDGTVPFSSATAFGNEVQVNSEHSNLPSVARGMVYQSLSASSLVIATSTRPQVESLLEVRIFSPADIQIVAPDGRRIGKNFETGQEINEIVGAFYSGFLNEKEYVTIPNPLSGQYKIINMGNGNGEYLIRSVYISGATTTESSFQGETFPGLVAELNLNLDSNNLINETSPADTFPPSISILMPVSKDYLHSEKIPLHSSIVDEGVGVVSSTTLFDGTPLTGTTTIDLFFQTLGFHTMIVTAKDFVGNESSSSVQFQVIATPSSTISDINRAYSLGWISKKSLRDRLIAAVRAATFIQKVVEKKVINGKITQTQAVQIIEKLDKILGRAILFIVEFERGRGLNEQAYQTLKADILWLLK